MAYPRSCPLCGAEYGASDWLHATVRSEPGGTPSPWRPGLPGSLLTLRCQVCGGEYAWDYFADAADYLRGQVRPRFDSGLAAERRRPWETSRAGRTAPD